MYKIKKAFLNFLLFIKNSQNKPAPKNNRENIFNSGSSKSVISQAASLEIRNKNDEIKKEVETIATALVKENFDDTEKTLKVIKSKKIQVYRVNNALNILKYINEKPGFITPLKGFKGLYLNFITALFCDKKFIFKSESDAMFVFSKKEVDKFFLAAQIHKFVAFRKKLPGFEYEIQEKFKKLYKTPNETNFNKLTAGDIFAIKEAIARDAEAADFALNLNSEEKIN